MCTLFHPLFYNSVDLIIKTYASLGAGSAEFHGIATESGRLADERVNDLLAYVVFHEALKPLQSNSSVLQELSNTTRYYFVLIASADK